MAAATTDKAITRGIRLMTALCVLALGFLIVRTIITFTNPESVWEQPALAPISAQNRPSQNAQNFDFSADPFNRNVEVAPEIIAEVGEDAPETTLNLTLTGRTAGPNGTAILRTPDNKESNYRLGDEVVTGVTLEAVNKDFIVLNVDGQIQRLTFERGQETGLSVIKTEAGDEAPKTTVSVKAPVKSSTLPDQGLEVSADVTALFQNISLRRVMKDGRLKGYSVKANRPGVDLTPFGFSKGDIVTAIGSTDITRGRPDFLALFEQAAQSGSTEVTVLRNGQTRIIKLGTP